MKRERDAGTHFRVGVSLTPWEYDVTVAAKVVRSRFLVFMLGPWRWTTEFVRLIDDNGDI